MCKKFNAIYILSIFLSLLIVQYSSSIDAALSSQELRDFNKKLTSKDLTTIYTVTQEINQRGEKHQLFVNGLRLYLKDERIPFRFFIAETLAKIGDPYGLEYLKDIVTNDESTDINQITALYAIGNTRLPEAITILQPYVDSEDRRFRTAAITGLLKCGMNFDAVEMSMIFNDYAPKERVSLLHALADYRQKYMPVYALALEDSYASVADTAFKYLVKLEDFGGIDTIYSKLSKIKHDNTRLEAELLLAEKNVIHEVSFVKEYVSVNAYGRSLLLEFLRDCMARYPRTVKSILASIAQNESDDFLLRRIIDLQAESEKGVLSEQ